MVGLLFWKVVPDQQSSPNLLPTGFYNGGILTVSTSLQSNQVLASRCQNRYSASCPYVDLFTLSDCTIASRKTSHLSLTSSFLVINNSLHFRAMYCFLKVYRSISTSCFRYITDLCPNSTNVSIDNRRNSVFSCAADREFTTRRTCCQGAAWFVLYGTPNGRENMIPRG